MPQQGRRAGRSWLPPFLRRAAHPAQQSQEMKVVLGDYYGALASAGVWSASRARPWPVERAVFEGYERLVYVFRSVEAIAGQASRLPFRLKEASTGDVLDDHPLYRVLNKQANPMETGRQFRKRLGSQILLSKRGAFVQVTTARNGDPVRMDLLPPGRTRPVPGGSGNTEVLIDHYEVVRADGTRAFIPAEEVRWFREPHPLDPYSGVTPLEAAGMSAELDFFSRLYNVQFMKNDARPGGVLAINGDMDPDDMDRIERKFGHGPAEAGKMTVIAGEVSYVDSVVRPRDMQYGTMASTAKTEILTAFGVPESVLGYAADRTYANAAQEHLNFWQITMPPILDLEVTGLDDLTDDDLEGFFDVSQVPALQAAEAQAREEKRAEFAAGLISPDEYRIATGREPYDLPATRALYISSAMTPVPTSKKDASALAGTIVPSGSGGAGDSGAGDSGAGDDSGSDDDGDGGGDDSDSDDGGDTDNEDDDGDGDGESKALPAATPVPWRTRPQLRVISNCRVKEITTDPSDGDGDGDGGDAVGGEVVAESQADEAARQRLEDQVAVILAGLAARWQQRTIARLASPKARKGTRHWQPDMQMKDADTRAGDAPLDAEGITDGPRWQAEAEDAVRAVIEAEATNQSLQVANSLAPALPTASVTAAARAAARQVIAMIGNAAAGLAAKVASLISAGDQAGQSADEISDAVRAALGDQGDWAGEVATQAATATQAAGRNAAATAVSTTADPGVQVTAMWRSRRDAHVRETHRIADGQLQPAGNPFLVGGALLAYPGDPAGPPGETYNCRCRLDHRVVRTGQYTQAPPWTPVAMRRAAAG